MCRADSLHKQYRPTRSTGRCAWTGAGGGHDRPQAGFPTCSIERVGPGNAMLWTFFPCVQYRVRLAVPHCPGQRTPVMPESIRLSSLIVVTALVSAACSHVPAEVVSPSEPGNLMFDEPCPQVASSLQVWGEPGDDVLQALIPRYVACITNHRESVRSRPAPPVMGACALRCGGETGSDR